MKGIDTQRSASSGTKMGGEYCRGPRSICLHLAGEARGQRARARVVGTREIMNCGSGSVLSVLFRGRKGGSKASERLLFGMIRLKVNRLAWSDPNRTRTGPKQPCFAKLIFLLKNISLDRRLHFQYNRTHIFRRSRNFFSRNSSNN